jgi:RHS repeat-associated protein
LSFDPWGQRRYAEPPGSSTLWGLLPMSVAASFDTSVTRQGYTGHEQLDGVGLIHMKGRLYDPKLGRFIQADPFVESDTAQGLNRYSYVLNNPLSLTDPSGYLSFRQVVGIVIAVVAAYFGQYYLAKGVWAASFGVAVAGGFASAYVATGSLRAGLWGAFAAGVFWGIGTAFSQSWAYDTGFSCGAEMTQGAQVAKIAAHGAAGGTLSELQGGNFGHGFVSAGVTQAVSPSIGTIRNVPMQAVASAAIGGTASKLAGGSFSNGAATAAFQYLFNHAVHEAASAIAASSSAAKNPDGVVLGISSQNDPAGYGTKRDALLAQHLANDAAYQSTGEFEELWGFIASRTVDGQARYYFSDMTLVPATFDGTIIARLQSDMSIVQYNHTHPNAPDYNQERFSSGDRTQVVASKLPFAVRTPAGDMRVLSPGMNGYKGESLCGSGPCLPPHQ